MTSNPNSPRYATDPPPADKPEIDANRSIRQASITAGAGLLLMSALAGFGYQVAVKGLVTQGDAAKTINTFSDIWDAGLVLFGFHLLLIAYLAYRSSFVPNLLTVLLAIAGLGYLFDSFGRAAGSSPDVSAFTFIGEFLLALWLVTRGRRIHVERDGIPRRSDRCSPMTAATRNRPGHVTTFDIR